MQFYERFAPSELSLMLCPADSEGVLAQKYQGGSEMTKRRSKRSSSGFDWRAILSDPTFRDVVQQAMAVIVVVVGLITLPAHAEFIEDALPFEPIALELSNGSVDTVGVDASSAAVVPLDAADGSLLSGAGT